MIKKKSKIKRINNSDAFSQASLIIFTKGDNIFGHDCNGAGEYEYKLSTEIRGRPIIGADIKHFYDYRYRPFSKQICR